ncbi:MAG: hypothetical protein KC457_22960 [Myxococcales bacterium]|nr:hypothetical protein [Myxococcales bacterium]
MSRPRTLPAHPEAEDAVLGAIILRGREALLEVLEVVGADDFYQPRAKAVFNAMQILADRGEAIDIITLEAQLRRTGGLELAGGITGLADLDKHATVHNVAHHAALVREASVRRELVLYHRAQADALMSDGIDSDGWGSWSSASQNEHTRIHARAHGQTGLITMREAMRQGWAKVTARATGKGSESGSPWGFAKIDSAIGPMLGSELWIIAARSGNGKSAFAWATARNQILAPHPEQRGRWVLRDPEARVSVLYSSCEQEGYELALRGLSEQAMVDGAIFRKPRADWVDRHQADLVDGMRTIGNLPISVGFRPRYTMPQAIADARVWLRRERDAGRTPKLMIFDYLQRYRAEGSLASESRERQVAENASALKDFAQETKLPVLALAQVLRDVDKRGGKNPGRATAADLRESSVIEFDADGIGMIWRPERYHPDARERADRLRAIEGQIARGERLGQKDLDEYRSLQAARLEAWIDFPKARGGPADAAVRLEFLPEFTRFLDALE